MKLGIVAQRPIFITPYKSTKPDKSLRHKDFRDSDKNVSSRISMHLNAKKVYKRCVEKVKQPRKIQCNKDYNNTPISYRAVRNWGVVI